MSKQNGVGISKYTQEKQRVFSSVLGMHLKIAKSIMSREGWVGKKYIYVDMHAGPGKYNGDNRLPIIGSPLRFLREVGNCVIPHHAYFIEKRQENINRLKIYSQEYGADGNIEIFMGDSAEILPKISLSEKLRDFGLVYCDPTGSPPPLDALVEISKRKQWERIDFLIFIAPAIYKRVLKHSKTHLDKPIHSYLRAINKRTWIVREPMGPQQFTFLLGSNWRGFPVWEAGGFHDITSGTGRDILRTISLTKEEKKLFDGIDLITRLQ